MCMRAERRLKHYSLKVPLNGVCMCTRRSASTDQKRQFQVLDASTSSFADSEMAEGAIQSSLGLLLGPRSTILCLCM